MLRLFMLFCLFFYSCFNSCFNSCFSYKAKIINTAILPFFPNLKQHHIVLLSKEDQKSKPKPIEFSFAITNTNTNTNCNKELRDVYIIDYTPKIQQNAVDYMKLFLGYKIPGIVRVIYLPKSTQKTLVNDWFSVITSNPDYTKIINNMCDENVSRIINNWDSSFNLYLHNCQHFSGYLIQNLH